VEGRPGVVATLRGRYRALVPKPLRQGVRRLLGKRAAKPNPPRAKTPTMLRYDLTMPDDGSGRARPKPVLRIEALSRLWMPRHMRNPGLPLVEAETMALLLALIEVADGPVFDVGANVGPLCVVGPALFDREFVGFEPAPDSWMALRDIVAANGLRCRVETIALGEAPGTMTLFLSGKSDLSNSLRAGFREEVRRVEVPVARLDDYAANSGLWPVVLKIDAETTEAAVLRGAPELLSRRPWIVCEVLPGWGDAEIEAVLTPLGYRYFRIADSVPYAETPGLVPDPEEHDRNWLFAPAPPSDALWASIARWRAAIDAAPPAVDVPRPA